MENINPKLGFGCAAEGIDCVAVCDVVLSTWSPHSGLHISISTRHAPTGIRPVIYPHSGPHLFAEDSLFVVGGRDESCHRNDVRKRLRLGD